MAALMWPTLDQCLDPPLTASVCTVCRCWSVFCSFIHYGFYVAPLQCYLGLRSAPDPCTAKKNGFPAIKCVGKNPGEQSPCQWKPISHIGANHPENARAWIVEVQAKRTKSITTVPLSGHLLSLLVVLAPVHTHGLE